MIDEKIARVKKLIQQREEIDAELGAIFGLSAHAKRGRPRKEESTNAGDATTAQQVRPTQSSLTSPGPTGGTSV